jgi:hypothetical protein
MFGNDKTYFTLLLMWDLYKLCFKLKKVALRCFLSPHQLIMQWKVTPDSTVYVNSEDTLHCSGWTESGPKLKCIEPGPIQLKKSIFIFIFIFNCVLCEKLEGDRLMT